ncbi:MAG: hypothetical protein MUF74_03330 [Cypionkella sp.]|jgi:hypothetical protein|nr:hypothetical protein [Cypionkella sp.]
MANDRLQDSGPKLAMGLGLLWAEMQALALAMPGVHPLGPTGESGPAKEARERAHDAEVEAAFDNMPV